MIPCSWGPDLPPTISEKPEDVCQVICTVLFIVPCYPWDRGGMGKGALGQRETEGGGSGNHPFSELCPFFQLVMGAGSATSRTESDTTTVLCEKVGHRLILERVAAV